MTIRRVDLAWAAGFIDGEGCLLIQSAKRNGVRYYWIMVSAPQVNPEPLIKLQTIFGGAIHHRAARPAKWADIYEWHIGNRQAASMLHRVLPYLLVKRGQADLLLTFDALLLRKGKRALTVPEIARRAALADAVKALNRKGISKPLIGPKAQAETPKPTQLRLVQ